MKILPRQIVVLLIELYQKLSRALPRKQCRFWPTCSQYPLQSVEKYGVFKGLFWGIKRISRCHPANPGGIDELN